MSSSKSWLLSHTRYDACSASCLPIVCRMFCHCTGDNSAPLVDTASLPNMHPQAAHACTHKEDLFVLCLYQERHIIDTMQRLCTHTHTCTSKVQACLTHCRQHHHDSVFSVRHTVFSQKPSRYQCSIASRTSHGLLPTVHESAMHSQSSGNTQQANNPHMVLMFTFVSEQPQMHWRRLEGKLTCRLAPLKYAYKKPAAKQSPAPTVSTTSTTGVAHDRVCPLELRTRQGLLPLLTTHTCTCQTSE